MTAPDFESRLGNGKPRLRYICWFGSAEYNLTHSVPVVFPAEMVRDIDCEMQLTAKRRSNSMSVVSLSAQDTKFACP